MEIFLEVKIFNFLLNAAGIAFHYIQIQAWALQCKHPKTSFEKICFSAWVSTLNMGLINKRLIWYVGHLWDMVFS